MSKYNIKLSILTPLNIGEGSEQDYVKGANFVEKDGKIYFLNMLKLAEKVKLDDLVDCFKKKDSEALVRILGNNLEEVSDRILESPSKTDNDIKAFIRNQFTDCPIIPGSSLKGAIRSHVYKLLGGDGNVSEKDLFGDMNTGDNVMRFIKVSDFDFNEVDLVNTKIYNLHKDNSSWIGGWKHGDNKTNSSFSPTGFNTVYEVLSPGQVSCGSIITEPEQYIRTINFNKEKKKGRDQDKERNRGLILSLSDLFISINQQTKDYLTKEREFFEHYSQADNIGSIIDSIGYLIECIPDNGNACLIKMSAGSGYHSITGDWRFTNDYFSGELDRKSRNKDDKTRATKAKPKSRKIAISRDGELSLMGFVLLEIVSEEEAATLSMTRRNNIDSAFEKSRKIISIKEESMRKEAELANKIAEYKKFLDDADSAIKEKRFADAKDALSKAEKNGSGDAHVKLWNELSLLEGEEADKKAQKLKKIADEKFQLGKYAEALTDYEQIQSLNSHVVVLSEIELCRNRLTFAEESIEEFVSRLNIASPGAFAGNCKKRKKESNKDFTLDDIPIMAKKIRESICANPKLAKDWKERKKYKPIEQELGTEVTEALYQAVIQ